MEQVHTGDVGRAIDQAQDFEVLVLAEVAGGTRGRRFEIQGALRHDEQDRVLGLDTHCVVDGTGATVFGAINDWRIE